METLRERSNDRVARNATFLKIQENAKRVKRQSEMNTYPLTLAAYKAMDKANKEEAEQYKDLFDNIVIPGVANIEIDMEQIQTDESKEARNDEFKKSVGKAVYIQEALNILYAIRGLVYRLCRYCRPL